MINGLKIKLCECLKELDMFLTQLSRADGVLRRWIFKRPAYAVNDFIGDGTIQAGYAEEDYANEGFDYAS